jgi:hypothetical protein
MEVAKYYLRVVGESPGVLMNGRVIMPLRYGSDLGMRAFGHEVKAESLQQSFLCVKQCGHRPFYLL